LIDIMQRLTRSTETMEEIEDQENGDFNINVVSAMLTSRQEQKSIDTSVQYMADVETAHGGINYGRRRRMPNMRRDEGTIP